MRGIRKLEHINHSLLLYQKLGNNTQESEIRFIPQELPEKDLTKIDLSTSVVKNQKWDNYLYINASTGGTENTFPIIYSLANIAKQHKLTLAIGSQTAMIANNTEIFYKKMRKKYPNINIIANVPAHLKLEHTKRCVEAVEADMLQVHINLAQEAVMPEGDREFLNYIENITNYAELLKIPLIIKGVGYGIARETLKKLNNINYIAIDIAGNNGTNFVEIENSRRKNQILNINNWGLSTFESLLESKNYLKDSKKILASGGIYRAIDAIKCIALGASAVGVMTPILNFLIKKEYKELDLYLQNYLSDSKTILRMLGCQNLKELQQTPLLITGSLYQYSQLRNIDIEKYANR